jgi:hypothetical protein
MEVRSEYVPFDVLPAYTVFPKQLTRNENRANDDFEPPEATQEVGLVPGGSARAPARVRLSDF